MKRVIYIGFLSLMSTVAGVGALVVTAIIGGAQVRRARAARYHGTTRSQRRSYEDHLRGLEWILIEEARQQEANRG